MAPALDFPGIPSYLCGHNLLKAHAKVYHMYKNKFGQQKGESVPRQKPLHTESTRRVREIKFKMKDLKCA
jgi:hypothetical protein